MARTKKTTTKKVNRGEVAGYGATVAAAKADLNRRIDVILDGDCTPRIVKAAGKSALVWRDRYGWNHDIFHDAADVIPADNAVSATCVYGSSMVATTDPDADLRLTIQRAIHHMLNLYGADYHDDSEIPAELTDKGYRSALLRDRRFQRAYRYAVRHTPVIDHHRYACDHAHDPMFA
jgi:hypothetical protein